LRTDCSQNGFYQEISAFIDQGFGSKETANNLRTKLFF
jgi:hypothetical protein